MVDNEGTERIYIGGLNPSSGLTVSVVVARLRAVKDVEILSINNVATDNNHLDISKMTAINHGVDSFNNRNFFFLDARTTTATTTVLNLLAKQYHNVKWKGCQIRVEAAKPPFLARLAEERSLRVDRQGSITSPTDEEVRERESVESIVKVRRSLRIRKRFGEEAFHVDTRPHPLKLSPRNLLGWDTFASLHTRMREKRQTQQRKLVERRKVERRLWASGKRIRKNDPASAESDSLRGLSFLNRAIHIRFSDQDDGSSKVTDKEPQLATGDLQDQESVTSSSDSEEPPVGTKSYVWSDDDSADDGDLEEGSQKSDGQHKTSQPYTWIDEGGDNMKNGMNDDQSRSSGDSEQSYQKKNMDGLEYTKTITIDEFSGGMDFDLAENDCKHTSGEDGDDSTCSASDGVWDHCLNDDIRSNMGVLSTLFPDEHFEKQPLAAPISDCVGDDGRNGDTSTRNLSSLFGTGLIMQRYDPTKESHKKFEMLHTNPSAESLPGEEMMSPDKGRKTIHSTTRLSVSSGSLDKGRSTGEAESPEMKPFKEAGSEISKAATNAEGTSIPARDVYQKTKLGDGFKQTSEGGKPEPFLLANISRAEYKIQTEEEPKGDIYEQEQLEGVFRQVNKDIDSNTGVGGFTFGFHSQLPDENSVVDAGSSAPFSFGFEPSNAANDENVSSLPQKCSERNDLEPKLVDKLHYLSPLNGAEAPKSEPPRRKRWTGMTFLESDLNAYDDIFFDLNEGPKILKDLDAMKADEENQEHWEKERLVLTADWKRKQKSALSRKVKKIRRF